MKVHVQFFVIYIPKDHVLSETLESQLIQHTYLVASSNIRDWVEEEIGMLELDLLTDELKGADQIGIYSLIATYELTGGRESYSGEYWTEFAPVSDYEIDKLTYEDARGLDYVDLTLEEANIIFGPDNAVQLL